MLNVKILFQFVEVQQIEVHSIYNDRKTPQLVRNGNSITKTAFCEISDWCHPSHLTVESCGVHLLLFECQHHLIPLLLECHGLFLHGPHFVQQLVQFTRLALQDKISEY